MPIIVGQTYILHRQAVDTSFTIDKIIAEIDKKTKKPKPKRGDIKFIGKYTFAEVQCTLSSPLPLEPDQISKSFGRFVIRGNGETLGYGLVTGITQMQKEIQQN